MDIAATPQAIFGSLCDEFARTRRPMAESVVALRGGKVQAWVTPPDNAGDDKHWRLGLVAALAQAETVVYMADSYLTLDGEGPSDALVCVEMTLTGDGSVASSMWARPYTTKRKRLRRRKVMGPEIPLENPEGKVGPLIRDLTSSMTLYEDSAARINASEALIGANYAVDLSDELDQELCNLLDDNPWV